MPLHRTLTPWFTLSRHDDTGDAAGAGAAAAGSDTAGTGDATGGSSDDTSSQESKKTFTQAELDKHIADRLARQKAQYADYDDLKSKAAELQKIEDAQKTELDRERDARAKAEQVAQEATDRAQRVALRAAVVAEAAKAGAVDTDAVLVLLPADAVTVTDDGTVTGAAEAVATLLAAKPYLKAGAGRATGDADQGHRGEAGPVDLRKADQATYEAEMAKLGLRPRR